MCVEKQSGGGGKKDVGHTVNLLDREKEERRKDVMAEGCFYATLPSAGEEPEHLEEFSCRP